MQNSSPNPNAVSLGSLQHLLALLPKERQQRRAALNKLLMTRMGHLPRKQAREAARLIVRLGTASLETSTKGSLEKLNRDLGKFFR